MVLCLERYDEHMASGAELDFLNVFSSFQRNFCVITECLGEHIHKLNFVRVCNNDLIAARVKCNRLRFLTWLAQERDLKLFGCIVPDFDLARRAGDNQSLPQADIKARYPDHMKLAEHRLYNVCYVHFELDSLVDFPANLNFLKLIRLRCIINKILLLRNAQVHYIILIPCRRVRYCLNLLVVGLRVICLFE